ncbi:MAG: hypothetical protein GY867_07310 [bacterium]|nr:hypothetical protein [bacterium]
MPISESDPHIREAGNRNTSPVSSGPRLVKAAPARTPKLIEEALAACVPSANNVWAQFAVAAIVIGLYLHFLFDGVLNECISVHWITLNILGNRA